MNLNQIIEFLRTRNIEAGEFVRQIVFLAVGFEFVKWTEAQQMLIFSVCSAGLALLMTKQNLPKNQVDNVVAKGIERAVQIDMMKGKEDGAN